MDEFDQYSSGGYLGDDEGEPAWDKVSLGGMPSGLDLLRICLGVVRKDKEILVFGALAITLSACALGAYLSIIMSGVTLQELEDAAVEPAFYFALFPYYVVAYFIASFFNTAAMACASIRLMGGAPTVYDGLAVASRHIGQLFAWAVAAATVGVVIAAIRSRSRGWHRLGARATEIAWSAGTFFVIPVMVYEDMGPLDAIPRSFRIVGKTWQNLLVGNLGLWAIALGLTLLGLLVALVFGAAAGIYVGLIVLIICLLAIAAVMGAANSVLLAALYIIARTGSRPPGFGSDAGYRDLKAAFDEVHFSPIAKEVNRSASREIELPLMARR